MSQSTTMTIRLNPELKSRLDKLSESTHRSKSYLAAEAVREYVDLNEWQIAEINAAITESDNGDFASEQEVSDVINKWNMNGN